MFNHSNKIAIENAIFAEVSFQTRGDSGAMLERISIGPSRVYAIVKIIEGKNAPRNQIFEERVIDVSEQHPGMSVVDYYGNKFSGQIYDYLHKSKMKTEGAKQRPNVAQNRKRKKIMEGFNI